MHIFYERIQPTIEGIALWVYVRRRRRTMEREDNSFRALANKLTLDVSDFLTLTAGKFPLGGNSGYEVSRAGIRFLVPPQEDLQRVAISGNELSPMLEAEGNELEFPCTPHVLRDWAERTGGDVVLPPAFVSAVKAASGVGRPAQHTEIIARARKLRDDLANKGLSDNAIVDDQEFLQKLFPGKPQLPKSARAAQFTSHYRIGRRTLIAGLKKP